MKELIEKVIEMAETPVSSQSQKLEMMAALTAIIEKLDKDKNLATKEIIDLFDNNEKRSLLIVAYATILILDLVQEMQK